MPDSQASEPALTKPAAAVERRGGWREEIAGGLDGALVAFPIAVPLRALAFAPQGVKFAGYPVAAALVSTAVGGLAALLRRAIRGDSRGGEHRESGGAV